MTIAQLLMQPLKQKIGGGFTLAIKTYKKNWQVGKVWWSQVILMDETGEMPADVKVGGQYNPLRGRTCEINVIVAEIQEAEYLGEDRKKLVIDQFSFPTMIGEPPQDDFYGDTKVIRGKVKCWLVAARVQSGADTDNVLNFATDARLAAIINSIMEG